MASAGETGNIVKSYAYDLAGNRTGFTLTRGGAVLQSLTYVYDAADRLVSSVKTVGSIAETTARTYDPNGNLVSELVMGKL